MPIKTEHIEHSLEKLSEQTKLKFCKLSDRAHCEFRRTNWNMPTTYIYYRLMLKYCPKIKDVRWCNLRINTKGKLIVSERVDTYFEIRDVEPIPIIDNPPTKKVKWYNKFHNILLGG
jgi:hypothetical protein